MKITLQKNYYFDETKIFQKETKTAVTAVMA